jgi:D-alanyl-lipoteichoic acid acyltransferase DltB (MBOAT superfamily)
MLFNTAQFFVFLAVVLALFYGAPLAWRKPILLAASYFFYMSWNAKFVLLLLTLTAIDFTAGLLIARTKPGPRRKLFLIVSLSANLGFLGFFKYYNFLADNLARLWGLAPHVWALDIILPLGISFHTFQSMSYVVDVYRGEQVAIRSPLDYALFIAFFPQLVAGPIVRAREFFGDLYHWRRPTGDEVLRGALMVLFGLVKKMVLADQFAAVADSYFKNIGAHPGVLAAWSGVIAFAMQIYFDFSGYTDMAIGMALLLGFHFPVNFRRPYLSQSITEFWRRWHISLSRWLRDYLYIPLGGNRHGRLATYRNLMLTMLLGGLWHGASWNFAIWGGYHGTLLAVERALGVKGESSGWTWTYPFRAILTFALVSIGWVFFRAANLSDSLWVIGNLFHGPRGHTLLGPWYLRLIALALLLAVLEEKAEWFERVVRAPAWVYASAMAILLFAVELLGVTEVAVPFIYFQF